MSDWLDDLPAQIGQVSVARENDGRFTLCHCEDVGRSDLTESDDALEIARFDDAGKFRPLKTAANLRHGWKLSLGKLAEARAALDYFYPGRAAIFRAFHHGTLVVTPLRETLDRQTGMYRAAAKINDARAQEVIANFCGCCLRTILWKGAAVSPTPLLCQEACQLLVSKMREAVKE